MKFFTSAIALSAVSAVSVNQLAEPCEPALDISKENMTKEMDLFSRTFDKKHYNNAMTISKKVNATPKVSTWELLDKSFSWPKVRQYPEVLNHMDEVQHWEDNLNTNISNSVHVDRFIEAGKSAVAALNSKYHNGEFTDPATVKPDDKKK